MKYFLLIACFISLQSSAQPSGYSLAKEMGVAGKVKTMRTYYHETHKDKEGHYQKSTRRPYSIDETTFDKQGNIIYTATLFYESGTDTLLQSIRVVYNYDKSTCLGYSVFEDNMIISTTKRHWLYKAHYRDSVFSIKAVDNKDMVLVSLSDITLDDNYKAVTMSTIKFYDYSSGRNADKKLSINLYKYETPVTIQNQPKPENKIIARDIKGNVTQEVFKSTDPNGEEFLVEYTYEYY